MVSSVSGAHPFVVYERDLIDEQRLAEALFDGGPTAQSFGFEPAPN